LEEAINGKWKIVISDWVKEEIYRKNVSEEDLEERLSFLRAAGVLEEVEVEQKDMSRAKDIQKERDIHLSDALHTTLAIRYSAIVVTRNLRHFGKVSGLVEVRKPEELL